MAVPAFPATIVDSKCTTVTARMRTSVVHNTTNYYIIHNKIKMACPAATVVDLLCGKSKIIVDQCSKLCQPVE